MFARLLRSTSDWIARQTARSGTSRRQPGTGPNDVLSQYVHTAPSAQNAIDTVPGWTFPVSAYAGGLADMTPNTVAGYADFRIAWCLEQYGSIAGRKILELGPLEGMQTYVLDQEQPEFIHAIEANRLCFLRCLVTKELLNVKRAKFLHGNFLPWLEQTEIAYDLIIASGVLYHMSDPVKLLDLLARRSNALYLWTHYFSDEAMPKGDPRRGAFTGDVETVDFHGLKVPLHGRSYHGAWKDKTYCGGIFDRHSWMEADSIVGILRHLGFDDIRTAHEQRDQPNGPSMSIFARRSTS